MSGKKSFFSVAAWLVVSVFSTRSWAQIPSSVEFKVGVQTASTKRNVSLNDAVVDRASAAVKGLQLEISPAIGGGGVGGRILNGSYGSESMSLKEGKIFVGDDWLRVEGAYGQRSLAGTDSTFLFTRAGGRSIIRIGGSGVAIHLSGSKYFKGDFSNKKSSTTGTETSDAKIDGWEGETGLSYAPLRVPVFAQLGYRVEYFSFGTRAEHLSGLVLQTGIWLGGR